MAYGSQPPDLLVEGEMVGVGVGAGAGGQVDGGGARCAAVLLHQPLY